MSIFSLLAAIVASATALWIAYRVYPLQKAQDRWVKVAEEKAAVYRVFFDAADDYHEVSKADWNAGHISDFKAHFVSLNKAQRALLLYAPGDVIVACSAYADSLRTYRYAVRKKCGGRGFPPSLREISAAAAFRQAESCRENALIATRIDLLGCSLGEAGKAVSSVAHEDVNGQVTQ